MPRSALLRLPFAARRPSVRSGMSALAGLVVLSGLAALSPGTAEAAAGAGLRLTEAHPAATAYDEAIGLEEAVRRVRERTGGRVLRAETRRENGRVVHRVRVLSPDGRVRTWSVDADTGRIS